MRILKRQMENLLKYNHLGWKYVMMYRVCTLPKRRCCVNILIQLKFLNSTCFVFITSCYIYIFAVCPLYHELLWKFWTLIFYSTNKCIEKSVKKSSIFIIFHLFTILLNLIDLKSPVLFSSPSCFHIYKNSNKIMLLRHFW